MFTVNQVIKQDCRLTSLTTETWCRHAMHSEWNVARETPEICLPERMFLIVSFVDVAYRILANNFKF